MPSDSNDSALMRLTRNGDVLVIGAVVLIIIMLIIPLPQIMLDLLITVNIAGAVMILLISMYVRGPLEFSAFPSMLLILTLFRLALNVSSTRLILTEADAGNVIRAFGEFVVAGNFVVGLIIFVILALIQFVVITSGAGRVAEVAARFTLDAMPGKQLSIDADLNAGIINENDARQRRHDIQREADFYGAMDDASKFVRGDAIAALIIIVVNIVGGLAIGVAQQGLEPAEALDVFIRLTVGDGLVSQIPALLVATATGIIVTRAGSDADLGQDIVTQLLQNPRPLMYVGVVVAGFGLVPGLPTLPFLIIGVGVGSLGFMLRRERQQAEQAAAAPPAPKPKTDTPEAVMGLLALDPMELEIGYGLIPLVDVDSGGTLLERISGIRRQTALELGIVVPTFRIRDNLQLNPNEYVVKIRGLEVARGELMVDQFLAMDPGTVTDEVGGIATTEPAFGLPALWVNAATREHAEAVGYTVVDPPTVLSTHLTELIRNHAADILGRQDVQRLLDNLKQTQPAVVETVVPDVLGVAEIHRVLQNLLRERVPIRDLASVMEVLGDFGRQLKDPDVLAERVRAVLARTITQVHVGEDDRLHAVSLTPAAEEAVSEALRDDGGRVMAAMEPGGLEQLIRRIEQETTRVANARHESVLVCSPNIRLALRRLLEREHPRLPVLAYTEISSGVDIAVDGVVRLES